MKKIVNLFLAIVIILSAAKIRIPNPPTTQNWSEEERALLVQGLKASRDSLISKVQGLSGQQWNFKENPDRWSIREIVEHLEVQDEMYFREVFLVTNRPPSKNYAELVRGNDKKILQYEHDPTPGGSGWLLAPVGRYCSREEAELAFLRTRKQLIQWVGGTDHDLRSYFTFRNYQDDGGLSNASLWDIRDLHQLMLTCIAHTRRHIGQLKKVKAHPDYPEE